MGRLQQEVRVLSRTCLLFHRPDRWSCNRPVAVVDRTSNDVECDLSNLLFVGQLSCHVQRALNVPMIGAGECEVMQCRVMVPLQLWLSGGGQCRHAQRFRVEFPGDIVASDAKIFLSGFAKALAAISDVTHGVCRQLNVLIQGETHQQRYQGVDYIELPGCLFPLDPVRPWVGQLCCWFREAGLQQNARQRESRVHIVLVDSGVYATIGALRYSQDVRLVTAALRVIEEKPPDPDLIEAFGFTPRLLAQACRRRIFAGNRQQAANRIDTRFAEKARRAFGLPKPGPDPRGNTGQQPCVFAVTGAYRRQLALDIVDNSCRAPPVVLVEHTRRHCQQSSQALDRRTPLFGALDELDGSIKAASLRYPLDALPR